MATKRDREEDVTEIVLPDIRALEVAVQKGSTDAKLKALLAIQRSVNPEDEAYTANRELVEGGILPILTRVLADESVDVRAAGAHTLELLSQHSPPVLARLADGQTLGNFNPVQETLGDRSIIRLLVEDMVVEGEAAAPAHQALTALASYNRVNRLAILDELVARLLAGNNKAVEEIDTLVSKMEMKDDLAVILDQAVLPLISLMGAGKGRVQAQAAALLATMVEQRPAVADFIRNKGGLEAAAHLLKTGSVPTSDVAVHTLWLLVKDTKTGFAKMLDFPAVDLVEPLLHLIQAGHEYDRAAAEASGDGGRAQGPEVDNDNDAALLLKALAAQDADVRERIKHSQLASDSKCSMM
eukprot:jgi/Botrbrau1/2520/Bobra.0079s0012.1